VSGCSHVSFESSEMCVLRLPGKQVARAVQPAILQQEGLRNVL
jgi:hypothetical protein